MRDVVVEYFYIYLMSLGNVGICRMENKSEAMGYNSDYEGNIDGELRYRWRYDGMEGVEMGVR